MKVDLGTGEIGHFWRDVDSFDIDNDGPVQDRSSFAHLARVDDGDGFAIECR